MLFNSITFLCSFAIVTILYWALPNRWRWALLLAYSCLFYMAFVPIYILILGFTIVMDYWMGIFIENTEGGKKKLWLVISLISNIGVLSYFKYYNFFIENINAFGFNLPFLEILLPIGLSFHTFQAMSYTIEVYRGHQKAERHFGIYALYVMFFPQLVAGPIERPQNMLPQFKVEKYFSYENATSGLKLMAWGLLKKVVIADRLALLIDPVFTNPHAYTGIAHWVAAVFFSFQIFCDFSGYTDIARGSAKVLGYELMVNFNQPYSATSVTEFWQRWHISLSTWFRDYLYIPLGGNQVSIHRWIFNIYIVFIISGLWHGAAWTFAVWGFLHACFLVFERYTEGVFKKDKNPIFLFLKTILTFIIITLAWVFFRANSISDALFMIKNMFPINYGTFQSPKLKGANFTILSTLLIFILQILEYCIYSKKINIWFINTSQIHRWILYYILILIIIFLGIFENRQFIYFQF